MSKNQLTIYMPQKNGDKSYDKITRTVDILLQLLFGVNLDFTNKLVPETPSKKNLIIIPSLCESTIQDYLKEILHLAYSNYSHHDNTLIGNQHYLFIRMGTNSPRFNTLSQIFSFVGTSLTVPISQLLFGINKSLIEEEKKITPLDLRQAIEQFLPSGPEELQELVFWDRDKVHEVFGLLPQKNKSPAIRLLLGAFMSGDIDKKTVKNILKTILKKNLSPKIDSWLSQIEGQQEELDIQEIYKSPLSEYLGGRRLFVIEDEWKPEYWNIVLPTLFRSRDNIEYRKNTHETLVEDRKKLVKDRKKIVYADIILLDLYSSKTKIEKKEHLLGQTSSTIGNSIWKFIKSLKEDIKREESQDFVPIAFPQLVVFSQDATGLSTRTMIKELGASDYFFKETFGDPYKGTYYSTFRNVIISSLLETLGHILAMPHNEIRNRLILWLQQFLPSDRPLILRVMKHFRYYSAKSIVKVLNTYLCKPKTSRFPSEGITNGYISLFSNIIKPENCWFSYLGRPNKSGPATLALLGKSAWLNKFKKEPGLNQTDPKDGKINAQKPKFMTYDELQTRLIEQTISKNGSRRDNICIVLVDDFIGSGGQLKKYIWKFVNVKLRDAIKQKFPQSNEDYSQEDVHRAIEENWNKACDFFKYDSDEQGRIELHALYAIGLKTWGFKKRFQLKTRYLSNGRRSVHGITRVKLCTNPSHLKNEEDGWQVCNCPEEITVQLHIADYIDNLSEICRKEEIDFEREKGIDFKRVKRVLSKANYTFITNPREKEYHCQFEPMGWKQNGGLVATYANAQANSLSIIWGDNQEKPWQPLFHRFFNPWDEGSKENHIPKCEKTYPPVCFLSKKRVSVVHQCKSELQN